LDFLGISEADLYEGKKIGGEANPDFLLSKEEIEILPSRQIVDGKPVPTAKSAGKFLHSLYNPIREADTVADNAKKSNPSSTACAFFGFGLGHAIVSYAKKFPNDSILIVEPNPKAFFTALSCVDWSPVFSLKNVVIALASGADLVVSLIEKLGGLEKFAIVSNPAQTQHAAAYFSALNSQIERNRDKDKINKATLERFSKIWQRNISRNIKSIEYIEERRIADCKISSVCAYADKFAGKPFVILAAGPSLADIIPHLAKVKAKAVVIAVDTALRACLRSGVEPDFLVLCDPQYYAYKHVAGLSSPSSVLVTEIAAYPPVFHFPCKEIALSSSNCPLEKLGLDESLIAADKKRGLLSSGGSVSTTAWDFARLCGAKEIYFAGLDLGFPKNETHARGSTFEEAVHSSSTRLASAETSGISALFGANMLWDSDYEGGRILTDNRMKMFAWWFESRLAGCPETKTYTLCPQGLAVPGIQNAEVSSLLARPEITDAKKAFLSQAAELPPLCSSDSKKGELKELISCFPDDAFLSQYPFLREYL